MLPRHIEHTREYAIIFGALPSYILYFLQMIILVYVFQDLYV